MSRRVKPRTTEEIPVTISVVLNVGILSALDRKVEESGVLNRSVMIRDILEQALYPKEK